MQSSGGIRFAFLVLVVLMQRVVADEWKIGGAIDQSISYDDNIGLRAESAPVFGYLLKPQFKAGWGTAETQIGVSGRGDIRRYDDERWDCENFSLNTDNQYRKNRNTFSVSAGYAQSCSYVGQLIDTGLLVPNNQSESFNSSVSWNWQWSLRDQITVRPSYSQTNYSSVSSSNNSSSAVSFRNNETYSIDLSEQHQWSHRFSSNTSLFFSNSAFSSAGNSSGQNVFGFQLGGQYSISRAWSFLANGGLRWVQRPSANDFSADPGSSLTLAHVGSLSLNYKGRDVTSSLSYSRSINPSAFGQLLESNAVDLKYAYQLDRGLSLSLDGSASEYKAAGQALLQTASSRTFYTASMGVIWDFARNWRLSANYRYRRQEYPDTVGQIDSVFQGTRESNAVMLSLKFNWDGWRVSR